MASSLHVSPPAEPLFKVKVLVKVEKKPFLPKCPCCKTGNLHRIAVFDQRGPPAWYLGVSQNSNPCEN
jgi:hypothetical protein